MGAQRHVRACPEQRPARPQQAEPAEEHPNLGLGTPKPSLSNRVAMYHL